MQDKMTTTEIQEIATAEITRQTSICEANLNRVRDKIEAMNGDIGSVADQLAELRKQVENLTMSMVRQIAELTLMVNKQVAAVKAETQKLNSRWSIWPTLKEILLVIVSISAMVISILSLTS